MTHPIPTFLKPIALCLLAACLQGQEVRAESLDRTTTSAEITALPAVPLWTEKAPGAHGSASADVPTVTPYLPAPDKASGAALLVFAGGSYAWRSSHEGEGYGRWLAEQGIAAFVVNYRISKDGYHYPAMWNDATRAIRLVRFRAAEWGVDPHRVGVIGSSAGGHLASLLLTHFDAGNPDDPDPIEQQSSRPDLGILCYAVITMGEGTHLGSRNNLLGPDPAPGLAEFLSSEKQVTLETPPCFIWHMCDDEAVVVKNAMAFADALRANGVRFELHVYEKGGHGLGLGSRGKSPAVHRWTNDCLGWLREKGYVHN
jgi:acetyl esterase/lipase